MKREILTEPNHELRLESRRIAKGEIKDEKIQDLIDDLIETMEESDGIGIAAPQVGVQVRIIVIGDKENGAKTYINPKVSSRSIARIQSEEGCLSVPGVYGVVTRFRKITVKAYDRHGNKVKIKVRGMDAVVFQHEIDHLDGILFIDKVHHFTNPPTM
jgi:peptide deformylase